MRQILVILTIALIGCQPEIKTSPADFKTTVFNLDKPKDSIGFEAWQKTHLSNRDNQKADTLFSQDTIPVGKLYYSDEQFLVYRYCMGEFGGALMFQGGYSANKIIRKTISSGDIYVKSDSIVIAYKFNETTENK
jgi:hypothetical protein